MKTTHRGFTIEVLPEMGEYVVKAQRDDGSLLDHENNPTHCEDEDDAVETGKQIIDEFLDN